MPTPIDIAIWPIIVAAVIRIAVGTVWYSPVAFVKPWQQLTGITPESMQQGLVRAIIIDAILSLIMAFVLFHAVMYATGSNPTWLGGAIVGFLSWLGFVLTIFLGGWAYENRPLKLIAINAGHNLVALVLMGALFGVWHS